MIYQNSRAVLNPRRTVLELLQEPLKYNHLYKTKEEREALARQLLDIVEISKDMQYSKPAELSTGQCQRVAIARTLISDPNLLICDEAVSSLHVNIQYQILKLLFDLKKKCHLSIVMISQGLVDPYTKKMLEVSGLI